jgi:hypothetical protein
MKSIIQSMIMHVYASIISQQLSTFPIPIIKTCRFSEKSKLTTVLSFTTKNTATT